MSVLKRLKEHNQLQENIRRSEFLAAVIWTISVLLFYALILSYGSDVLPAVFLDYLIRPN